MARTPSTMLPLGTPAPDFTLRDTVTGRTVSLADFMDAPALLVMFICNHCPYVIHVRETLARLVHDRMDRGLAVVAINANSVETHPQDGPEHMAELARAEGWRFPYLFDDTQDVAHAYHAACTPDFFLFDQGRRLVYRGQLDDSRPSNGVPVTGADLARAIDACLAGEPPLEVQRASLGCNIKWRPGNEPKLY
ncbi:MAG: thioredoxin family protein [Myxococcales bacterium]